MSTPMPPAPPRRRPRRAWTGPLLWIAGAFVVGLLVTLLLLMRSGGNDFFRADGSAAPVAGPDDTEALPAPMSGREGASGMDLEPPAPDVAARQERPRVEEPPPPPEPVAPPPPPGPAAAASPARPLPDQSPPPRYPMAALRRGEGGEVVVRAQIGPDGVPTSVSIVQGSGSRALDREAQQAVRRWRFEPARGPDGAPTVDTVQVPIRFTPP